MRHQRRRSQLLLRAHEERQTAVVWIHPSGSDVELPDLPRALLDPSDEGITRYVMSDALSV